MANTQPNEQEKGVDVESGGYPLTVTEMATMARQNILSNEDFVKKMMRPEPKMEDHADVNETRANIVLALRHLEDARMRLVKVLQAQDGGKSVYDR